MIDVIMLFGDSNIKNVVFEKSYREYLVGFMDIVIGKVCWGYIEVVNEFNVKFFDLDEINRESDKKEFVKVFGEYLCVENIFQNYDEFIYFKVL